ncbi:hypothetical protein Nepgr_010993 [Nepenthes gracilis]|uniref:Uncharacterized protein n=1 Tax=Nepenthes gracilis TaxID=150966 RepID=A0AAD3SDD6_NEPGR|nr:hypothetical protein Nepgr_010993 [Nepenthes gracilis]
MSLGTQPVAELHLEERAQLKRMAGSYQSDERGCFLFPAARDALVAPSVESLEREWHARSHEPGVGQCSRSRGDEVLDPIGERVPQRWAYSASL